jgi:hypothetical protein
MPNHALIDLIVALLHEVIGPHGCRCGHRGGRRHRRTVAILASPYRRVLEWSSSPSLDKVTNRSMVLWDLDAHLRGR